MAMNAENYCFEIFCIEPEDLGSEHALSKALAFSASLWKQREPKEYRSRGVYVLEEAQSSLSIKILPVDVSKMLTSYIEAAYLLKIESQTFDELEGFRLRILKHLREYLKFRHIRVLRDDVSTHIANKLYPEINAVESLLRRYLIKFFIQRVGLDWWEVTATPKMIEKVKSRLRNRGNPFSYLTDPDIEFADFDDLGQLIYQQSTGFNQPERVWEKLLEIETKEQLEHLKSELRGNYFKYFQSFFRDKNFEGLWKEMSRIRNKVAHQSTFFKSDLENGLALSAELQHIIREAESQIEAFVLSLEEKQAIRQASIEAIREAEVAEEAGLDNDNGDHIRADNRVKLSGPKIVGKISLPQFSHFRAGGNFITEEEILDELMEAQNLNYTTYIGLKWFVTSYLANKGYSIGPSYSLVNILIDKGKIELYDVPSQEGNYEIKAIRLP